MQNGKLFNSFTLEKYLFDLETLKKEFNSILKGDKQEPRNIVVKFKEPEKLWYGKFCCDVRVTAPLRSKLGTEDAIKKVRKRFSQRKKKGWWISSLKTDNVNDLRAIIKDFGEVLPYPKKGYLKIDIYMPFSNESYDKLKEFNENSTGKIKQINKEELFKDKYEAKASIHVKRRTIWDQPHGTRHNYFRQEFAQLYALFSNQPSSDVHLFSPQIISYYENRRNIVIGNEDYMIPMSFTLYLSKDQISYLAFINRELFSIDRVEVANV